VRCACCGLVRVPVWTVVYSFGTPFSLCPIPEYSVSVCDPNIRGCPIYRVVLGVGFDSDFSRYSNNEYSVRLGIRIFVEYGMLVCI
jgi:hypothetical protein